MPHWFATITDVDSDAAREALRRGRYGIIETAGGRVVAIHFRPWPKLVSWPEFWPAGLRYHARGDADRCLLYYNQPRGHSNFLALKYVVSTVGTSYATARAAARELDRIAELKQTDALLCDAGNSRLSDRFLARFGWEPHKPQRWHRNFIKRFYGVYPRCNSLRNIQQADNAPEVNAMATDEDISKTFADLDQELGLSELPRADESEFPLPAWYRLLG